MIVSIDAVELPVAAGIGAAQARVAQRQREHRESACIQREIGRQWVEMRLQFGVKVGFHVPVVTTVRPRPSAAAQGRESPRRKAP